MKSVIFVTEFIENEKVDFAILFAGVMDDKYIYAKRVSLSDPTDAEYIKLLVKNTTDATDDWSGMPDNIPVKTIEISTELGLDDPRIESEPFISEELKNEILRTASLV